jgi:L-rhamnose mutarotase
MKLKEGYKEEYKKRHDFIWPELLEALRDAGISQYSIFLDEETNILFALQNITDDYKSNNLIQNDILKKWWVHMEDIMDTNADKSPISIELVEVFYMD